MSTIKTIVVETLLWVTLKSQHPNKSWLNIPIFVWKWRKIPLPEGMGTCPQKLFSALSYFLSDILGFVDTDLKSKLQPAQCHYGMRPLQHWPHLVHQLQRFSHPVTSSLDSSEEEKVRNMTFNPNIYMTFNLLTWKNFLDHFIIRLLLIKVIIT